MILLDVNVLVDAFRGDQPRHPTVRADRGFARFPDLRWREPVAQ